MTSKVQWTVVIAVAVLAALLLISVGGLVGWALARPAISGWAWPFHMGNWMGPWMMGGSSGHGGMMGPGYPGSGRTVPRSSGEALCLKDAHEAVEGYLQALTVPGLAIAEVMEFADNFYAEVVEESTGVHAMELLVDKETGAVYPEYGPNMMWNTKYGMHSRSGWRGMMGWFGTQEPSAEMPVSAEQALQCAQRYLEAYIPGTQVADEADGFYGYYTVHVLKDGQIYGMLSVNGYSGQVWYHNWHGQFVGMLEPDENYLSGQAR